MRRFYFLVLGFFLLTVRAEKDFQGYHTEQTKGTAVTKDLLLKQKNTIDHGTEALPTENTHQHSAVAVTAKFPKVFLFDTRPTTLHERIQTTKALTVIASQSKERFVSRNGHNSFTSQRGNSTTTRVRTESEIPLISNYEKIVFSSSQAAFESMMNDASEPEVHLSTDAVKSSLWLPTLHDNRNQRSTDSIPLTSVDGGPGVPGLSASHPQVIDKLAALHNDKDDKRAQAKGISKLRQNEYPFSTTPSIFQNHTAEDSFRGSSVTNLCLTCLKDRRAVSTEAQPALSPDISSVSYGATGFALDFSDVTSSLQNLHKEEILNKNISHQNIANHYLSNLTFPLPFNKTAESSQSFLTNSQIMSFISDRKIVTSHTQFFGKSSSVTQTNTKKQSKHTYPRETSVRYRLTSTNTAHSQSKLHFTNGKKNAFHSLSTHFKNLFIQNLPLDISSGSVSNTPVIVEAAHSSQKSVLPEGTDHRAATHPTARMSLIEAHSTVAPFSFDWPTTSAVKNPESHSVTGRVDSLISVLRSQTPAKPTFQTKEPILTLSPKDSSIKFTSVTTETHLTPTQDTFNTLNSMIQQTGVEPFWPFRPQDIPLTKTQISALTTKSVVPVMFLLESRKKYDDISMLTIPTPSSKSSSERLTMNRFFGTLSKITQKKPFDMARRTSFAKYNWELIKAPQTVHRLKLGDKNEQVLSVAAEDQDKEINKTEGNEGKETEETEEILKLHKAEKRRKDLNKKEGLFKSDKTQSREVEILIDTGLVIDEKTDSEEKEMHRNEVKTSREEAGGTVGDEDVTLRQDKKPRQEEVRDKEGTESKGMTTRNTEHFTTDEAGKQRKSLTMEGAKDRKEETASKEDIKHNREIGREDVTNVPLGATTDPKELNRDKGHIVTNPSSCHSLIKQLGATEQKGIHLGENTTQIVEMKNKPFSYKVTSNQRQVHSTLRSQSPKLSRTTSLPIEPYTQIKPRLSSHRAVLTKHGNTSSLTKESAQNKVFEAAFSVTAISKMVPKHTSASNFSDILKPSISPHRSATKSAHPVLNSISNTLSLTIPQLAITAGFLRAQPRFTVNTSTLRLSIAYSTSNRRNKFSTSLQKAGSLSERKQEKHIMPAHIFESRVKDPLTSNMIEDVTISSSVIPALPQQMYNDSSTKSPTADAVSSEAHIFIGHLQPQQGQPVRQIRPSSSSCDITSDQKCSFKLSEETAHLDASHASVDDNVQRSVQTQMASMSPEAKNNQFLLSSMSPLPNSMHFGGNSLPVTYNLTGLRRSVSEKEILRANSDDEHVNSGSGHAESVLETAGESNQTDENDSMQTIVATAVKHSDAVTKQMNASRELNYFGFVEQIFGKSKIQAASTDEINFLTVTQTEKIPVITTNKKDHSTLINIGSNDDANKTAKPTLGDYHGSRLESYNETTTKFSVFTHKTKQAIKENFLPNTNDFATHALDTNGQIGKTAFIESDNLSKVPKIQANDVTNNVISYTEFQAAKTNEKQHDPSIFQGANTVTQIHFTGDFKVPSTFTLQTADQVMDATSELQMITTKTSDSVSSAASRNGPIMSTEVHKSALTTRDRAVTEKLSEPAHAKGIVQTNSHIEPLSLRESRSTPTLGTHTPAVKRKKVSETQDVEQPEHEISVQATEQSQHAVPILIVTTCPITESVQDVQEGLFKGTYEAGRKHESNLNIVKREEYSSFIDIKTTNVTLHTLDKGDQHNIDALPEKTPISQVKLGAMTESVPHAGISPTEIIKNTSCSPIGCTKSSEFTKTAIGADEMDHTAAEKMHKTEAGKTGRHFNGLKTTDTKLVNGNCSANCPVPGNAPLQAANLDDAVLSPAASISDIDHAPAEEPTTTHAKSMTDEISTKTWSVLVETDHLDRHGTRELTHIVEKPTQRHFHRGTHKAQKASPTEIVVSEPEAPTAQNPIMSIEWTLSTEKMQLNMGAAETEIFEAQNATRSVRTVAGGETLDQESGRRLLLMKSESELELARLKHRRSTSPHLYLSGVTEVSEDTCGSGNYTAEMSLNLGRGVEPGDAVPALGNLRVVINLKTNNSRINLEVTSCCLSPTVQPDLTSSTCCLFSRLAAEPVGITLLPTVLSTSASFTISLFQMINYSVVYLHCDLSVCLRNRSDCERECLQQRSAFPLEGPESVVTNLKNRISFGPMLKEVNNATFPEEIDPSELDLALVIVSLIVGTSLVTVMLLLVWLAYRRRTIWPLHSAAPTRACCGCVHSASDLILP